MKNLFFYKLYSFDKRLFYPLAIFSGLTVLSNLKGDEITPFFIWAMYSEKEDTANRYEAFRILVNDSIRIDYSSGFTDNNRYFLMAPLSYYKRIKLNDGTEPTLNFLHNKLGARYNGIQRIATGIYNVNLDRNNFIAWYVRYLQQSINTPVHSLKVDVLVGNFTGNGQIKIDSSYSLIRWKQP